MAPAATVTTRPTTRQRSLTIWDAGCSSRRASIRAVVLALRQRREAQASIERGDLACWPAIQVVYGSHAHHARMLRELGPGADAHMMRLLLLWCDRSGVLVNPCVLPRPCSGRDAVFRDYAWVVDRDIPALTPLFAIPERLCIGYKDEASEDDLSALKRGTSENAKSAIDDAAKSATSGGDGESDSDICAFFFTALSLLVNDLLVATNNGVSDPRHGLASALKRTRTAHNAPYLSGMTFGSPETCLAEVFLQMVQNYISAGPLTGKVELEMLNWAVSISMSHSTPLTIAGRRSIGIVPLLHLVPHGADRVNAVTVTRRAATDGPLLYRYFAETTPYMTGRVDDEMIYVVTTVDLARGDEVAMQAMAPVCNRTEEAEFMWRLTCGDAPPEGSVKSADYQLLQDDVNREVLKRTVALTKLDDDAAAAAATPSSS